MRSVDESLVPGGGGGDRTAFPVPPADGNGSSGELSPSKVSSVFIERSFRQLGRKSWQALR
ncbi:protein of unknown function [Ralstonia solanacearum CFBP2957]|nr:protein of unknown function [Ralstonia solanacearum CFBP2957]